MEFLLVPAFNEATVIVSAVNTILRSRYDDFEIIVVNDGSTDDTLDVLEEAFALTKTYDSSSLDRSYSHCQYLPIESLRKTL